MLWSCYGHCACFVLRYSIVLLDPNMRQLLKLWSMCGIHCSHLFPGRSLGLCLQKSSAAQSGHQAIWWQLARVWHQVSRSISSMEERQRTSTDWTTTCWNSLNLWWWKLPRCSTSSSPGWWTWYYLEPQLKVALRSVKHQVGVIGKQDRMSILPHILKHVTAQVEPWCSRRYGCIVWFFSILFWPTCMNDSQECKDHVLQVEL